MTGLPWKLIGYGLGALALIGLLLTINGWRVNASKRKAELAAICQITREASNVPKLDCKQVPQQIRFMGEAIGTLTTAINKQNAAVEAMGAETKRQQDEAAKAVQNAAGRARSAEGTAERLRASARAGGLPSASQRQCEPSKVLQEQWR